MAGFINERIEGPFRGTFKGYNQYIFSGNVDDLFFMDDLADGSSRLCTLEDALVEYGNKAGYDLVIKIKAKDNDYIAEHLTAGGGGDATFNRLTNAGSEHMAAGHRGYRAFVPRGGGAPTTPSSTTPVNSGTQQEVANLTSQTARTAGTNLLDLITRVLKNGDTRTLVIFPEAEKLVKTGSNDSIDLRRIETVVKGWRNIVQTAHPDTRTVLLVNPHRLAEFHSVEQRLSCLDHNCREIIIPRPPAKEMLAWLESYLAVKFFDDADAGGRMADRIVSIGRANVDGNLQNFYCWVDGFYKKNSEEETLQALLSAENVEQVETQAELLNQLHSMVGLDEVKAAIDKIVEVANEKPTVAAEADYHMFFLGNPGTGKTEVAKIVGKLFWALELRPSRKFVEAKIQDIVSPYNEGDTLERMKKKVQEAMGGVLFVDEAYLFAESEWGRKALQILLTEMENNRKNLTVIFAGYADRLAKFRDVNPGIASRISNLLHFEDYTADQKMDIFKRFLHIDDEKDKVEHKFAEGVEEKLKRILEGCDGNARGVRTVYNAVVQKVSQGRLTIELDDVEDPHAIHPEKVEEILSEIDRDFVGMASMKSQLRRYFHNVEFEVRRSQMLKLSRRNAHSYRIRFTGPPGTGKTTIARYMGKFFHAMGICETSEFAECGATSLKGAYLGHAQQAVNNLFHQNRGKVIFIDEIYSLYNPEARQDDSFSREAIDTLVRCLTAEEYQGTIVIVAGYKDKVDKFMDANPGLASRIPDEIEFGAYSAQECLEILRSIATRKEYVLTEECNDYLVRYFEHKRSGDNFGNARDVNVAFEEIVSRMSERLCEKSDKTEDDYRNILKEDIPFCEGTDCSSEHLTLTENDNA